MIRIVAAVAVFALTMPVALGAHQLDEYLQAARVSLDGDRITLEIDLTPGASIASTILRLLDRDGDQAISPVEAASYGHRVLAEVDVNVDGRSVSMILTRAEASSVDEIRDGLGTIRLQAVGSLPSAGAGRRQLHVRNRHEPATSVYLANALMPEDRNVVVARQTRDPRQQEIRVEYEAARRWPAQLTWLAFGVSGVLALVISRRRVRDENV